MAEGVCSVTAGTSEMADVRTSDLSWSTIFNEVLTSFLGNSTYSATAPRVIVARECASFLIENDGGPICEFAEVLGQALRKVIVESFGLATPSSCREKLWVAFHEFRSTHLGRLWKEFYIAVHLPDKYRDPWFIQVVARLFLEKLIEIKHPLPSPSPTHQPLSADEHNALRYAAGYVLRTLKKRYANTSEVLAWIETQTDKSTFLLHDSFTEFTKIWVKKVNRGGLVLISDTVYELFHAMEQVLRQFLSSLKETKRLDKEKVIEVLNEDSEVQFYWSMMTCDLDSAYANDLLFNIIKLWITIRGFRYASCILEQYKRSNGSVKHTKSLRKELKQQNSAASD